MQLALALALLAAAALVWLWLTRAVPEPDSPPAARAEPRDPIREEVDRWMHQWVRGRA